MAQEFEIKLGTYRGRTYFLHIEAIPNLSSPEDYTTIIYYRDATAKESTQIARVDSAHGFRHFDRLYRRDEPKDPVDWGLWEAVEHFEENWRTYAESHDNR